MTAQTIDFKNFGLSVKDTQRENTIKYLDHLRRESSMEEITENDLLHMLKELNYSIDKSMCHDYYNNLNSDFHYLERNMSYKDNKTKQSYAHFEQGYTNRENLDKLQKIRQAYFVFDGKRIWSL